MELRELKLKDAPLMLEWMKMNSVVKYMNTNFAEMTLNDCEDFIANSLEGNDSLHLAISDDRDEYMGTVSLKSIDREKKIAEFAITVRESAMGKGYSRYGMEQILRKGFEEFQLETIYWYVSKANVRAIKFYDKNHYRRINDNDDFLKRNQITVEHKEDYVWYLEKR